MFQTKTGLQTIHLLWSIISVNIFFYCITQISIKPYNVAGKVFQRQLFSYIKFSHFEMHVRKDLLMSRRVCLKHFLIQWMLN